MALAPRPVEKVVAEEIKEIVPGTQVYTVPGGVRFEGPPETMMRVNLFSRCAMRVLLILAEGPCFHLDDLYELARQVPWEDWMTDTHSFVVQVQGRHADMHHTRYVSQRVKDAVVDRFHSRHQGRPRVDFLSPNLIISISLYHNGPTPAVCIALDTSGAPLFQRGYRSTPTEAPLKETLAATLLRMTGYHDSPKNACIVDPLCGSGTFLLEAAGMALKHAPGQRRSFAFERWPFLQQHAWKSMRDNATILGHSATGPFLFGSDQNASVLQQAKSAAQQAHVDTIIQWDLSELQRIRPPSSLSAGMILCNPPYGKRMGEEEQLKPLYRQLGDVMKRHFQGWTAYVFTANLPLSRQIGLQPQERHIVYNGPLEGRLLRFNLW